MEPLNVHNLDVLHEAIGQLIAQIRAIMVSRTHLEVTPSTRCPPPEPPLPIAFPRLPPPLSPKARIPGGKEVTFPWHASLAVSRGSGMTEEDIMMRPSHASSRRTCSLIRWFLPDLRL